MHRGGCAVPVRGERTPQLLREERRERGEQLRDRDQAGVQGVERSACVVTALVAGRVPEAAASPPDVPIGQVVDERGDASARAGGVVRLEAVASDADRIGELRQCPAIERWPVGDGRRGLRGIEALRVGVRHEERIHVPEREHELAHDLVQHVVADPARFPRRAARDHEPAQRVGALTIQHVPRVERVAERLRHLPVRRRRPGGPGTRRCDTPSSRSAARPSAISV